METTILSLTFFYHHESDVIGLQRALSERLDGLQEPPLERVTSRGSLLLDDFQQSFLSEHFLPLVLRVRKAVGVDHENISLVEPPANMLRSNFNSIMSGFRSKFILDHAAYVRVHVLTRSGSPSGR